MKRSLVVCCAALCIALALGATVRADTRYACETGEGSEIDLILTDTEIIHIAHRDPGLPLDEAHFKIVKRYSDDDGTEIIEASDGNPIKDPYSYFVRFYPGTLDFYIANDLDWDMEQENILHYHCAPILGGAPG